MRSLRFGIETARKDNEKVNVQVNEVTAYVMPRSYKKILTEEEGIERRREYSRRSYAKHKASHCRRSRAWESKNRERVNELQRLRRNRNRDARNEYMRNWRKSRKDVDPNKVRTEYRNGHLKKHGLTPEDYDTQYALQEGKCQICGVFKSKLYVDHCHRSKKLRGLLCSVCNLGIGHFKDSPEILMKAAEYLWKWRR